MTGLDRNALIQPLFIAVAPFGPADGEKWQKYLQWARIPRLTEVISLDSMLCERIVTELKTEDWPHIVNEDFRLNYFLDFAYLLRRTANTPLRHILGVYRNPNSHITRPPAGHFIFAGYDLIEEMTQISALTNCGGFPDCFSNAELNNCGLVDSFDRAEEIHRALPRLHPKEAHANCELYAVWKLDASRR